MCVCKCVFSAQWEWGIRGGGNGDMGSGEGVRDYGDMLLFAMAFSRMKIT